MKAGRRVRSVICFPRPTDEVFSPPPLNEGRSCGILPIESETEVSTLLGSGKAGTKMLFKKTGLKTGSVFFLLYQQQQ
jgi:hypothetical protein